MDAYLLAGNLLAAVALDTTLRRGRGRRTRVCAAGFVAAGALMLCTGSDPAVLGCAVSALGAGALLLAKLTTARRGALVAAWLGALALLVVLNVRQEPAGSWVADRKPWVTVWALAAVGALTAAAVGTGRMARDPDIGPGGV
ncbi:hypothetical protein [Streptomyces sp. IB2014 016-6]|uniref:hypothetical protein n=1 Tax=Streptomyces sp. IB2014 016-6 TaxID=2517818 RepID=UPI0011CBDBFC|nr:hypothetical protein [Streptomyces sp. IB2014 016-6]TXL87190.1 hypothetical protein EW053_23190 [Streptomyces sp. IB2014 016-6]